MKLAVWALIAVTAQAQNWPQFRGPAASGVSDGHTMPVSFDVPKGLHVRWRAAIPGIAVSSPIVWGNRVFVTTAVSSDPSASHRHGLYGDVEPSKDLTKHTWKLYCLDKKTGKVLWERTAAEGTPRTKRHPKSSQASCTPTTDGKRVVAHFGSEGLYAFDMDGKPLWKVDLGVLNAGWFYDPDYEWGVASSPILWRDMVIVQCDIQKESFVAAFRLKDGTQVWKTLREELPSWATPAVYEGKARAELVTHGTPFTRGYDPSSGKELWRLGPNSEIATPTPIIANGLIYVTNGYRGIQPIYAIKPGASGDISLPKGQTASDAIAWSKQRGGPYTPTPLIYGGLLYCLSNNGVLCAYDAQTGERVYQQRVGSGGSYSASPVAGDGKLYLASEDGDVHVVKAGRQYELLASNPVGEVMMATPAISDGMLIVRGMNHVVAIGDRQR